MQYDELRYYLDKYLEDHAVSELLQAVVYVIEDKEYELKQKQEQEQTK